MSRIGKKPIIIPNGVTVSLTGQQVKAKGPKGELEYGVHPLVKIDRDDDNLVLNIADIGSKAEKELWGTNRQLVANIITGVKDGYTKVLEINGVGYKAEVKDGKLVLNVGYSHPVEFPLPDGVKAQVEKNVITLVSIDKQLLGEIAAKIRQIRPPEPYKGKGIKYMEEVIKRKAGKQVKTAAA